MEIFVYARGICWHDIHGRIPGLIQHSTAVATISWINCSQLAKMKKSIPDMSLPWNLCVKFGAISWKFDILSI